jgi:hypothetical protein
VDHELNRLQAFPGFVAASITVGNRNFQLDKEQQRELQRMVGEFMYASLANLFASEGYKSASDEEKEQLAKKLISAARDAARQRFVVGLTQNGSKLVKKSRKGLVLRGTE